MTTWRTVAAFLIAPLVGAAAFWAVFVMVVAYMEMQQREAEILSELSSVPWQLLLVPIAVAFAAELLFGVPLYLLFKARRWDSARAFALGGAAVGLAVAFALYGSSLLVETPAFLVLALPACIVPALPAALAFRYLAGRPPNHGNPADETRRFAKCSTADPQVRSADPSSRSESN